MTEQVHKDVDEDSTAGNKRILNLIFCKSISAARHEKNKILL
jgi:hypothetical protein